MKPHPLATIGSFSSVTNLTRKRQEPFINIQKSLKVTALLTLLYFCRYRVTYDEKLHIFFKNKDNPIPEIQEKLSETSLIPNTNYLAIYISPYSKYEPDPVKRHYYFRIKQLLLQYKISSQVVYNQNI